MRDARPKRTYTHRLIAPNADNTGFDEIAFGWRKNAEQITWRFTRDVPRGTRAISTPIQRKRSPKPH
jgi:hypothetical protein